MFPRYGVAMALPDRCTPVLARCGTLAFACLGLLVLDVQAEVGERYEADEVARSLLATGAVHEEGLQLHRWLTGAAVDMPADAEREVRMMTRAIALATGLTDSWIDALYGVEAAGSEAQAARKLLADANSAGASRCMAHGVKQQPENAPLHGYALERFGDTPLPAHATVVDVQYRCITSYISAHRVLALAAIDVLKQGRRPVAGQLLADLQAGMARDRHWPQADGGDMQLLSFWKGRAWSGDRRLVETLARRSISMDEVRPVDAVAQKALFADFSELALGQPASEELTTQILLWIPPVLRESLRSDVEAYVAAAAVSPLQCQPVRAQLIDEEGRRARMEVRCTVPALDAIAVPEMAASLPKDALEQHYRQVLGALRTSIGSVGSTTLIGFTTLGWSAHAQRWDLPVGAHAALQARTLLPTPVVDEWGKPSNISRFLPDVLRVQNIDPSALDEDTRDKIQSMRLQMADAMRGGWQ